MKSSLLRMERLALRLRKLLIDRIGASGQVYFEHRVAEYREIWMAVAKELGAGFTPLREDIWEIAAGGIKTRINNHQLEFDNPVTLAIAGQKPLVHRLLSEHGLKVPEHAVYSLGEIGKAYDFLGKHRAGCVIKPANGYGGKGVTTHVLTAREARRASILASLYSHELLIEAQIPGESYRLLVLGGKMVHAVCRRGPRLIGDGTSSVSDLLKTENEKRRRLGMDALDTDRDCLFTLKLQHLSLDSAPERGRTFLIKSVNDPQRKQVEVRTVYNETVTDLICGSIREDAERAADILGSDFMGVDIITAEPSVPLEDGGGAINEVNTTPALHHHYDSGVEKYPKPAVQAISLILERKRTARGRVDFR